MLEKLTLYLTISIITRTHYLFRRETQFNILNILIEELKVLETYCHTKNSKCNMLIFFMNKLCG